MRETGFSIWLEEICSTQAEAARLLGITDRSVRRYKNGERPVPTPVAKLMTVKALALFRPELAGDPCYVVKPWPDDPDDARVMLENLEGTDWTNFVGEKIPDPQNSAGTISPQYSNGPQKSDARPDGPQNPSGPQKSHNRTIGPQYSSSPQKAIARTNGLQNSDQRPTAVSAEQEEFRRRLLRKAGQGGEVVSAPSPKCGAWQNRAARR